MKINDRISCLSDDRTFQCNECGLMYATRGDLRQHVTKVHRCGIYAKMPAGGLSIRQRPLSSSKNSQRLSSASMSPVKQQFRRRETVYRCGICRNKFPHVRALERHHYDVHHIDPFDNDAMKNATIIDEEEVEDEQMEELPSGSSQQPLDQLQHESSHRDEDEQMAIIQFRNQHHNSEQSPLIVKIERGLSRRILRQDDQIRSFLDGYDDFETADDFLSNKPTPRSRQLQRVRRRLSKNSYDDSLNMKKEYFNTSNDDDEMDYENEDETGDTFVQTIDDDDHLFDQSEHNIIKYRSSTHKLT